MQRKRCNYSIGANKVIGKFGQNFSFLCVIEFVTTALIVNFCSLKVFFDFSSGFCLGKAKISSLGEETLLIHCLLIGRDFFYFLLFLDPYFLSKWKIYPLIFVWYILKRLWFFLLLDNTRKHIINEISYRLVLLNLTRFLDKTQFSDGFSGNDKSTNRMMHCIAIYNKIMLDVCIGTLTNLACINSAMKIKR